jgi:hypothetical protein
MEVIPDTSLVSYAIWAYPFWDELIFPSTSFTLSPLFDCDERQSVNHIIKLIIRTKGLEQINPKHFMPLNQSIPPYKVLRYNHFLQWSILWLSNSYLQIFFLGNSIAYITSKFQWSNHSLEYHISLFLLNHSNMNPNT